MDSFGSRYVWFAVLAGVGATWGAPSYAGVVTTGVATFSADAGGMTDSSTVQLTNGALTQYVSAYQSGLSAWTSLWTSSSGYGVVASTQGVGDATSNASVHWTLTLTNDEAVAQRYSYSFVLAASNISVIYDRASNKVVGSGLAGYGVKVGRAGGDVLYSASASIDQDGVLSATGASLANAVLKSRYGLAGSGFEYSWDATTVVLDLGVLNPSESLEIDYELTYGASSNFELSDPDQYFWTYGGAARVGFGDPSDFNGVPGQISVLSAGGSSGGTVPEPASLALLAAGLPALLLYRRRAAPI